MATRGLVMLTHHVQKEFDDDEVRRRVGECVDALPWRTREALETQRYIAPLPEGLEPVEGFGRFWLDANWRSRYEDELGETADAEDGVEFPHMYAPGRWRLSDGSTLQGKRVDAEVAQAALSEPVAA